MAVSPIFAFGATRTLPPHANCIPTASRHNPTITTTTSLPPSSPQDPILLLLQSCHSIRHFPPIHAHIVKSGRHRHDHRLLLRLLCLFSRWDSAAGYAEDLFESIPRRNVHHYTAFVAVKIAARFPLDAIRTFSRMLREHVDPSPFTFAHVLQACALQVALEEGRQVHGHLLKLGFGPTRHVRMRLVEFYGRCGEFLDARKVFDEMPERDPVPATILISSLCDRGLVKEACSMFVGVEDKDTICWTAMIDGFARNGRMNDALRLFREMQSVNVRPNEVTIACVLSACSQLGALELGRWVHSYIGSYNIKLNNYVRTALVDMYLRCGSLDDAWSVFEATRNRDVVEYNAMISGLALNGQSYEAIQLFYWMIQRGLRPSPVTFVGVLNACSHGGMVDLGFEIFHDMHKMHGVEPMIEHYGCMVDLMGRVGRLQDAYDFIRKMEVEPDNIIWSSLLGACRLHGNLELAEEVARTMISQEFADSGTYVVLSNVYASLGKWEEAARMRSQMRKKGIEKEPGCSSIEVDNQIHEFLVGDIRHPEREKIYRKLEEVNEILKKEGYSPTKGAVLQDIDEKKKEWALSIHSERLAICYGLISTEPGSTVRVVKNLRVCNDCHTMIKLIAKVTGRKIVVRDRKWFHHFENGSCSCGDFW